MALTRERLMELVHYDPATGIFTNKVRRGRSSVGRVLGSVRADDYVEIRVDTNNYLAHRLAWLYIHGKFPKDKIDHINMIKTDNRLINLRECNASKNAFNSGLQRNNASGVKGVSYYARDNKWVAELKIIVDDTVTKHRRYCKTFEEACKARRQFELELASPFLRISL